jgi:REP element-mobilizing transposase RayT
MLRLARLDAPGVLHHVMGRGIERRKIFLSDTDRNDFIDRLSAMIRDGAMEIYAWALMPNHFHLEGAVKDGWRTSGYLVTEVLSARSYRVLMILLRRT